MAESERKLLAEIVAWSVGDDCETLSNAEIEDAVDDYLNDGEWDKQDPPEEIEVYGWAYRVMSEAEKNKMAEGMIWNLVEELDEEYAGNEWPCETGYDGADIESLKKEFVNLIDHFLNGYYQIHGCEVVERKTIRWKDYV